MVWRPIFGPFPAKSPQKTIFTTKTAPKNFLTHFLFQEMHQKTFSRVFCFNKPDKKLFGVLFVSKNASQNFFTVFLFHERRQKTFRRASRFKKSAKRFFGGEIVPRRAPKNFLTGFSVRKNHQKTSVILDFPSSNRSTPYIDVCGYLFLLSPSHKTHG